MLLSAIFSLYAKDLNCSELTDFYSNFGSNTIRMQSILQEGQIPLSDLACVARIGMPDELMNIAYKHVYADSPSLAMSLGKGVGAAGIRTTWTLTGCHIYLQVWNDGEAPVEVDWSRSVYAQGSAPVSGLLPGTSSQQAGMLGIQPTVIPPGTHAAETLFSKAGGLDCLIMPQSAPFQATITLSISGKWITQTLQFIEDPTFEARQTDGLSLLAEFQKKERERAVTEQEAARQAEIEQRKKYNYLYMGSDSVCLHGVEVDDRCQSFKRTDQAAACGLIQEQMAFVGCSTESAQAVCSSLQKWANEVSSAKAEAQATYATCISGP